MRVLRPMQAHNGGLPAPGDSLVLIFILFPIFTGRTHPGCHWRGLRRHRHQRAVCHQGNFRIGACALYARQRAWRAVHRVLDAHRHRLAQVRHAGAAGRQPRRRRSGGHAGAGLAVGQRQAGAAQVAAGGGHFWHLPVLWRRGHHPGHLGAVGGGGAGGHLAHVQEGRDTHHPGHPVSAVFRAKARHGGHWQVFRPHHRGVVSHHRPAGHLAHHRQPRHPVGHEPALCADVHLDAARHHLRHSGCGGAVRHRRRGAVCRHGPLRQEAHPAGLVCHRHALPDAQLLSARVRCCCKTPRPSKTPSS